MSSIDAEKKRRMVDVDVDVVEVGRRTGSNNKHMDVTGLGIHVGVCIVFHRFMTGKIDFLCLVCTDGVVFPSRLTKRRTDSTKLE